MQKGSLRDMILRYYAKEITEDMILRYYAKEITEGHDFKVLCKRDH